MNPIDLEIWKRSDTDPCSMEYVGQPVAQEVFEELKYRLESTGYLPDEYFLMDRGWERGRDTGPGAGRRDADGLKGAAMAEKIEKSPPCYPIHEDTTKRAKDMNRLSRPPLHSCNRRLQLRDICCKPSCFLI